MRIAFARVLVATMLPGLHIANLSAQSDTVRQEPSPAARNYLKLPLAFERQGSGGEERFVARARGYAVGLRAGKATIALVSNQDNPGRSVSLEFEGSRTAKAVPGPELPGKVNYIQGNDPRKWQIGLATYDRVVYPETYPGIDVVYYGNQQQLEFDFVVKPGGDPSAIRLKVEGADRLAIDGSGALSLGETAGGLRVALPEIYQEVNGERKSIRGHYAIVGRDEVAFRIEPWDHRRALVIDPTIVYSTLLSGGLNYSEGYGIGVDSTGNILIAGVTSASDFPTVNAAQSRLNGNTDVFVTKINAAGTALIYSTYLGGSSYQYASGLAVDSTGAAWVTGYTESGDFPVLNPAQSIFGGGSYDAFVARLNAAGVLQFSTYLGGSSYDQGYGIAVDSSGNGYVAGYTVGPFPTTSGTLQPASQSYKAFVTKYGPAGALLYSTLLGGNGTDVGLGIAADSIGNAYITGYSYSSTFTGAPAGGAQASNNGDGDAFVAKLNSNATGLLYFTFLGGAAMDEGKAISVDALGNAYIAGQTGSAGLATGGAAQTALAGATDGFAAKLNPSGSAFSYVTYLGGSRQDYLTGLALDGSGSVYLAGYTDSNNLPTASPLQATLPGNSVSLFNSPNSGASWSAFDSNIPGAVSQISVNPAGSSAVVLTESGIYRTVNGGASWTQQYPTQFSSFASYLARSPVAPGTLYATLCCSSIYRSTDDGVTWTYMGNASGEAEGILADPLTASTIYLFGYTSPYVFTSTNGGATWNPAATGLPAVQVGSMVATTDGSLYAGTSGSGIYKSTNQGGSWTAVNTGLPSNSYVYNAESLSASGTTVYFASGTIYETGNGGVSWAATASYVGSNAVAASPQNASILYAFTYSNTVQESINGGATWNAAGTGLPSNISSGELVVDPSNSANVFVITPVSQAAFVTKLNSAGSALTWSTYLGGTGSTYAYAVATDGAGDVFVTGYTCCSGFPVTSSALPGSTNGAFITKISDVTAACSTSVSPGSALASEFGATLTFEVVAPSGCAWTASTNESWAVITSGSSGTGTGTIAVQISYNSDTRDPLSTAVLTVGSHNITITQPSSSCSYSLDQSSYPVSIDGGTVSAVLTASSGCPWVVTNNYSSAVSITSGASGTGGGTIAMTVTPNLSASSRTFYLAVGTAQIQITQPAPSSLEFLTATPCRIMDTRNPNGPLGGPFITGGTSRTIPIPSSGCGIPAGAVAYSLNITVVPRTGTLGYLTVWPAGVPQPLVSTLNSLNGLVLANAAIVPAGTSGSINAYATDDTDLVVDINGYFVPPATGTLQFYPLAPCRILDTRNPDGIFGGPSLTGGTGRSFPIPSSSCGVPGGAAAYSFNVTVVPQDELGYLTTWPTGQAQPVVSTLNSLNGAILANAAIVPAGTAGAASFYATDTTDLIVDINGYFAAPASGGLNFYTVTPCRVVDTRNANGPFGGPVMNAGTTRAFPLTDGPCGLPSSSAVQAYSLNMTVVPQGPLGYLTTWPAGGTQPVVSTLNALEGQVVANAALVPAGSSGSISVFVTDATQVIIDTNGYFGP